MAFTIFSPGDIIKSAEHNANFNEGLKLQGEKAINDVSATNSGVLTGSSQVLIDKFLVANGQNNTVDTGNTTAFYDSLYKYYICGIGSVLTNPISEPGFETITNWSHSETNGQFSGERSSTWKTEGTYSYRLICFDSGSAAGYNQISQSVNFTSKGLLKIDYKIVQNTMTGSRIDFKIILGSTTLKTIRCNPDAEGTLYVPITSTGVQDLIFRGEKNTTSYTNVDIFIDNLIFYAYENENTRIQSVATTIPTGMTKVLITPLMYDALETGDSITADVSIDNGSTYTEDVPINEWTPITSANGTQLIVKANLLTNDGTTSPKISGWRVLME